MFDASVPQELTECASDGLKSWTSPQFGTLVTDQGIPNVVITVVPNSLIEFSTFRPNATFVPGPTTPAGFLASGSIWIPPNLATTLVSTSRGDAIVCSS
jgi:hypothetical protein